MSECATSTLVITNAPTAVWTPPECNQPPHHASKKTVHHRGTAARAEAFKSRLVR